MVDQHAHVMRSLTAVAETSDEEVLVVELVRRHPGRLEACLAGQVVPNGLAHAGIHELPHGAGALELDDHGVHGREGGEQGQRVWAGISHEVVDHGGAEDQHRVGILQVGAHPLCEQRTGERFGSRGLRLIGDTASDGERGRADLIQRWHRLRSLAAPAGVAASPPLFVTSSGHAAHRPFLSAAQLVHQGPGTH